MQKRSILLIEDSEDYSKIINEYFSDSEDFSLTHVPTPHDAFQTFEYEKYDLIICDLHLPFRLDEGFSDYPYSVEVGARTIEELKNVFPETPVLGITAALENEEFVVNRVKNIVPVLRKPFSQEKLLTMTRDLLGVVKYNGLLQ